MDVQVVEKGKGMNTDMRTMGRGEGGCDVGNGLVDRGLLVDIIVDRGEQLVGTLQLSQTEPGTRNTTSMTTTGIQLDNRNGNHKVQPNWPWLPTIMIGGQQATHPCRTHKIIQYNKE